jgi:hypothetical protein
MFGPQNSLPYKTFYKKSDELTKSSFTHNLHDLRYQLNGSGRDTYIYNNNGGLSNVTKFKDPQPMLQSTQYLP